MYLRWIGWWVWGKTKCAAWFSSFGLGNGVNVCAIYWTGEMWKGLRISVSVYVDNTTEMGMCVCYFFLQINKKKYEKRKEEGKRRGQNDNK